jgi:hypothetical protein
MADAVPSPLQLAPGEVAYADTWRWILTLRQP